MLTRGDYQGASTSLSQAIKQGKSAAEKAEAWKFYGVAQYMLGKKPQAAAAFKNAIQISPTTNLTADEVADESVVPFFQQQKGSGAKGSAGSPPNQNRERQAKGAAPPPKTAIKAKKTSIRIDCNVANANVSIDGIAYGHVGSDLDINPGTTVLEIAAPGYKPKAIRVQIEKNTANNVKIELEKIQPKPKPKPKAPEPLPLPNTKAPAVAGGKSPKQSPKSSGGDLFADDGSAGAYTGYSQPQQPMQQQPMQQQPMQQQPMQQQPMMLQQQPIQQQPMQQQPIQQQPMQQQPMQQQPMMPQQQVMVPQAPMQPVLPQGAYMMPPQQYPPGYGASPSPYGGYVAPPPMYAPPPQSSPYGAYPAGPAPSYDPYGGYVAPPPEPPSLGPGAASATPTVAPEPDVGPAGPPPMLPPADNGAPKKNKSSGKKSSKSNGCGFWNILPFGAGQFCNGSTFKGLFFAGSELGALYFYEVNTQAAAKYQSQLNQVLADRAAARQNVSSDQQSTYDNDTANTQTQGNAAIAKAQQNAQYSIATFGGLWVVGIIDAYFFAPESQEKSVGKPKGKKHRLTLLPSRDQNHIPTLGVLSSLDLLPNQSFTLVTGFEPPHGLQSPGELTLGINWEL